jgi:hypothetical protein
MNREHNLGCIWYVIAGILLLAAVLYCALGGLLI